jgi:cytochrome P450
VLFQRPQDYLESPALAQLPHPFPFTKRAKVRADRRALDAIIDAEIAERRRAPTGDPLDVLESLVQNATMSDAEIRDQVVTLIGAGYDTTAASLAWMLWCAARAPDIWQQLRAEADDVFGALAATAEPLDTALGAIAAPSPRDADLLGRLDVADRVVRETLRLHPAGVLSPREAAEDVALGAHTINKGTLILWSAHLAGRDAGAWSDPLRFDPDRFLGLTPEQDAVARAAWVPFGRGGRNCIGFALAQMELTLMIARIAQRLDVTPAHDALPRPVGMVVNRPAGGVPMRVAARSS